MIGVDTTFLVQLELVELPAHKAAHALLQREVLEPQVPLALPHKMARLKQWCADATAAGDNGQQYDFVFVDQNSFEKHAPKTFAALATTFTDFKS